MSYKVTLDDPGTYWFINALLSVVDKHHNSWPKNSTVPERIYCELWNHEYGFPLTIDDTDDIKWIVDFPDEKDYTMFILRWT